MLAPAFGVVTGVAEAPLDAGAAAVTPGGEDGVVAPGSSCTTGEGGTAVTSGAYALAGLGRGESPVVKHLLRTRDIKTAYLAMEWLHECNRNCSMVQELAALYNPIAAGMKER